MIGKKIGITTSLAEHRKLMVTRHYADWIFQEGGIPLLIPLSSKKKNIIEYSMLLDALLLTGGEDLDPSYFGEEPHPLLGEVLPERDRMEVLLTHEMLKRNKPILGICRGCQVLNVAAGGSLYQDLATQHPTPEKLIQHLQLAPREHATHTVRIQSQTKLATIFNSSTITTNSFHHQAVKQPAPYFTVSARTVDGVIEAIESEQHHFALGVQWHPECMPLSNSTSKQLFSAFLAAIR